MKCPECNKKRITKYLNGEDMEYICDDCRTQWFYTENNMEVIL